MTKLVPVITILLLLCVLSPVQAQTPPAQPVVQAIMFWMEGCPHCHEVLDNSLPPLQEKFGAQLEITLIEVSSMEDIERLYEIAAHFGIPKEQVGVPFLIIGEQALIGSGQIPAELPSLIEAYLTQGGVTLPEIPGLSSLPPDQEPTEEVRASATPGSEPTAPAATLVHVVMLNTPNCHDCQAIAVEVMKFARENYYDQLTIETIDIVTSKDVEYLYQVADDYNLSREDVGLPLLIIGDQVLIEGEIPERLPELLITTLVIGGAERPLLPPRADTSEVPTATPNQPSPPAEMRDNGFVLAIVILGLMAATLVTSLASSALGKNFCLPAWTDWLIPILIVLGIGVAGYLSYVETRLVEAICGPVGDCNTVQSSPYAYLFGILPMGALGLLGYLALLVAWLGRRFSHRLAKPAAIAFWGMAIFAVVFSIYLTYLEPFVIKAACAWCLASAIIVTLLLLLGTSPAVQHFATSE